MTRGLDPAFWSDVVTTLERLFSSNAYIPANHAMSFGLDEKLRNIIYGSVSGKIVDIGCGDGTYSFPFLTRAEEVVCVDPLAHRFSSKSSDPRLHRISGVAEYLPLREKSVDYATAMFSFRDFLDKAKGLSEMKRVARRGLLLLEIFNPPALFRPFLYAYIQAIAPLLGYLASRGSGRGWRLLMPTIRLMPRLSFFQKLGGKTLATVGLGSLGVVYLPSLKVQN